VEEEEDEYEPTQEGKNLFNNALEILEYAKYLGIDINKDKDLIWIAVEGVIDDKNLSFYIVKSPISGTLETHSLPR